jgi:GNAT superfamily N-acetyltransferase
VNRHYFNYTHHIAQDGWERASFLSTWWRIYRGDPHWSPPFYPALRRTLNPERNPHLARFQPLLVYVEAIPRSPRNSQVPFSLGPDTGIPLHLASDQPVAAAAILRDPRRRDRTAYLSMLHCVNDAETLERLLDFVAENIGEEGYRRLVGPTGISPHLGSGMLLDHWDKPPPLHTPYNPPYLPEIVGQELDQWEHSQLYYLEIPTQAVRPKAATHPGLQLVPLDAGRLSDDLLELFIKASGWRKEFPPPDAEEAAFLVSWVGLWPSAGWLAQVDGRPVGYILLQPDLGPLLTRARGGRSLLWRLWLLNASRRPTRQGRLLFGGVLPAWRGQGIGTGLLQQVLSFAHQQGWVDLSAGPLPESSPAGAFLMAHGAHRLQNYHLYQREI